MTKIVFFFFEKTKIVFEDMPFDNFSKIAFWDTKSLFT
jgi:hypothetical protein